MTKYKVNEVFYSLQGEGVRAGTPNVFVRFTGCNLRCDVEPGPKSPGGFACDTEFASGRWVTLEELQEWIDLTLDGRTCRAMILTGGEPGLQVDQDFVTYFKMRGWFLAIETNGTVDVAGLGLAVAGLGLDWITLSPKVAEHAVKCLTANELKYVRGWGQAIPSPKATADHYLISPAFDGSRLDTKVLEWCTKLCLDHPKWRLSVQQHKEWKVR